MTEQLLDRPCPDCGSTTTLAVDEDLGMFCRHCAHIVSSIGGTTCIHAGAHSLSELWRLWTRDGHYLTMGWLDYCLWVKQTDARGDIIGVDKVVLTPTERKRVMEYSQKRLNPEHTVLDEIREIAEGIQ